ncbi:complement factor B-like [Diadema antillarum]|uniref:complement factor B-like n=1 Tax=Diadema antillarum TaxID=105358 RepID=UPI003A871C99
MAAKPCIFVVCWTWILPILPHIAVATDSCLTANLTLENGNYFIPDMEALPGQISVTSNVNACCNEGFSLQGPKFISCLSTGNFSSERPTCEDIDECTEPYTDFGDELAASFYSDYGSWNVTEMPPERLDQRTCQGTAAIPPDEERCHRNWAMCTNTVGSFTCSCKRDYIGNGINCTRDTEPCPELAAPEDGSLRLSNNNRSAEFGCSQGYILYGCRYLHCVRGIWVSDAGTADLQPCNVPVCGSRNPQRCRNLPSPANGTVYLTGRTIGSSAFYECNPGFRRLGDGERRCLNRGWSGSRPRCKLELDAIAESIQSNIIDNFSAYTKTSILRSRILLSSDTPSIGLDLVFALDRSRSITDHDFELAVNFTKLFVEKLGVSYEEGGTRFAALTFADAAHIAFNLTSGEDTKEKVFAKLDTLKNSSAGGTGLKEGLEAIKLHISPEMRDLAKKVVMILTDGQHNTEDPMALATDLKENGMKIFTVGIGSFINETALKRIASSPPASHYVFVKNYDVLDRLTNFIQSTEEDFSQCGVAGTVLEGEALVNNSFEASERAWPWLAYIYAEEGNGSRQLCSGALICNQWVLTAASCFDNLFFFNGDFVPIGQDEANPQPFKIKVVLGEHNTSLSVGCEQTASIENFVLHDGYDIYAEKPRPYNLALVNLTQPVELSSCVRTVCLPPRTELEKDLHALHSDTQCYVTGWGSSGLPSPEQSSTVPLQSSVQPHQCRTRGSHTGPPDPDTAARLTCPVSENLYCRGDRGSPLFCPRYDGESSWSLEGVGDGGKWCPEDPFAFSNRGYFAKIGMDVVAWINDITANCTANHRMKEELDLQS